MRERNETVLIPQSMKAVSTTRLSFRRWLSGGKWRSLAGGRRSKTCNGRYSRESLLRGACPCLRILPSRRCRSIAALSYSVRAASGLARVVTASHIGERRQNSDRCYRRGRYLTETRATSVLRPALWPREDRATGSHGDSGQPPVPHQQRSCISILL